MFENIGKLSYGLKMMIVILLTLTPNLLYVAYCEKTDEAKIIILRPGDEDEDDIDMMFDSLIVAEIEPGSRNEVTVTSGKHWLIFRYGPRRFPEYQPKYYGAEINMSNNEILYLKASYRSWADQFFKLNIDKINNVEAENTSADFALVDKVFNSITPIKTIRAREYKKVIDDLVEESADTNLFRYSASGISIKIPTDKSDTLETNNTQPTSRSMIEIEDDIKGARRILAIGIPILCLGVTTSTVAYSFVIPNTMIGKTADDLPVLIGFGGLMAIGGGFALTKIGSTRVKRFRQELADSAISLHFSLNEICFAINF